MKIFYRYSEILKSVLLPCIIRSYFYNIPNYKGEKYCSMRTSFNHKDSATLFKVFRNSGSDFKFLSFLQYELCVRFANSDNKIIHNSM